MNQVQRLDYLLDYLCGEQSENNTITIPRLYGRAAPEKYGQPCNYTQKQVLFRSLVNVRPPRPVSDDFIRVQDAFLQEEIRQKGIVTLDNIPPCPQNSRISLWQGDITCLRVDAIVNAANSELLGCFVPKHHCIDNAIHTAAGIQLREECYTIMRRQGHPEATGTAKITKGYNLPSKYVLHTVGPIVRDEPTNTQIQQLSECYHSCLDLAVAHDIRSVAFCCISTGIFAFPKELAAKIAIDTSRIYLEKQPSIERVIFNVFTDDDFAIYHKLFSKIYR